MDDSVKTQQLLISYAMQKGGWRHMPLPTNWVQITHNNVVLYINTAGRTILDIHPFKVLALGNEKEKKSVKRTIADQYDPKKKHQSYVSAWATCPFPQRGWLKLYHLSKQQIVYYHPATDTLTAKHPCRVAKNSAATHSSAQSRASPSLTPIQTAPASAAAATASPPTVISVSQSSPTATPPPASATEPSPPRSPTRARPKSAKHAQAAKSPPKVAAKTAPKSPLKSRLKSPRKSQTQKSVLKKKVAFQDEINASSSSASPEHRDVSIRFAKSQRSSSKRERDRDRDKSPQLRTPSKTPPARTQAQTPSLSSLSKSSKRRPDGNTNSRKTSYERRSKSSFEQNEITGGHIFTPLDLSATLLVNSAKKTKTKSSKSPRTKTPVLPKAKSVKLNSTAKQQQQQRAQSPKHKNKPKNGSTTSGASKAKAKPGLQIVKDSKPLKSTKPKHVKNRSKTNNFLSGSETAAARAKSSSMSKSPKNGNKKTEPAKTRKQKEKESKAKESKATLKKARFKPTLIDTCDELPPVRPQLSPSLSSDSAVARKLSSPLTDKRRKQHQKQKPKAKELKATPKKARIKPTLIDTGDELPPARPQLSPSLSSDSGHSAVTRKLSSSPSTDKRRKSLLRTPTADTKKLIKRNKKKQELQLQHKAMTPTATMRLSPVSVSAHVQNKKHTGFGAYKKRRTKSNKFWSDKIYSNDDDEEEDGTEQEQTVGDGTQEDDEKGHESEEEDAIANLLRKKHSQEQSNKEQSQKTGKSSLSAFSWGSTNLSALSSGFGQSSVSSSLSKSVYLYAAARNSNMLQIIQNNKVARPNDNKNQRKIEQPKRAKKEKRRSSLSRVRSLSAHSGSPTSSASTKSENSSSGAKLKTAASPNKRRRNAVPMSTAQIQSELLLNLKDADMDTHDTHGDGDGDSDGTMIATDLQLQALLSLKPKPSTNLSAQRLQERTSKSKSFSVRTPNKTHVHYSLTKEESLDNVLDSENENETDTKKEDDADVQDVESENDAGGGSGGGLRRAQTLKLSTLIPQLTLNRAGKKNRATPTTPTTPLLSQSHDDTEFAAAVVEDGYDDIKPPEFDAANETLFINKRSASRSVLLLPLTRAQTEQTPSVAQVHHTTCSSSNSGLELASNLVLKQLSPKQTTSTPDKSSMFRSLENRVARKTKLKRKTSRASSVSSTSSTSSSISAASTSPDTASEPTPAAAAASPVSSVVSTEDDRDSSESDNDSSASSASDGSSFDSDSSSDSGTDASHHSKTSGPRKPSHRHHHKSRASRKVSVNLRKSSISSQSSTTSNNSNSARIRASSTTPQSKKRQLRRKRQMQKQPQLQSQEKESDAAMSHMQDNLFNKMTDMMRMMNENAAVFSPTQTARQPLLVPNPSQSGGTKHSITPNNHSAASKAPFCNMNGIISPTANMMLNRARSSGSDFMPTFTLENHHQPQQFDQFMDSFISSFHPQNADALLKHPNSYGNTAHDAPTLTKSKTKSTKQPYQKRMASLVLKNSSSFASDTSLENELLCVDVDTP